MRSPFILRTVGRIGGKTRAFVAEFGQASKLLGESFSYTRWIPRDRRLLLDQMAHIGSDSLPLVFVIGFFTGMVSAWQAAYQFKGLIPYSLLGAAVSRAIFIELGPVLTAIVIAGRVGASIAAELGTMRVTEQIDALESLAISPARYLALPRIVAAIVMMPLLVIFANTIALLGAYLVSNMFLDISSKMFFDSVQRFFHLKDIFGGLVKALFFGGVTALIGVHVGMRASGGAEGVGNATIRAFVLSSAMILVMDYMLWTILF
ncbi:MAG: ABC transporter permease [Bacteroidota bacterium]|nr:ABC transporter permease [Bacteroidota bacterium]MDP4231734.1 ABC transporter permease [Bacteroidota bacterium]MDP4289365.1 ABC transporter permease [Bacteroidota bacterium]